LGIFGLEVDGEFYLISISTAKKTEDFENLVLASVTSPEKVDRRNYG
jgi:hypothetical protein